MTLSDVLAIGISLALCYTLMSLLASTIKEAIAATFQWRAKDLETGIASMLATPTSGDTTPSQALPPVPPAVPLAQMVYAHPMVAGMLPVGGPKKKPSYVPARNFSLALLDVLTKGTGAAELGPIKTAISDLPEGPLKVRLALLLGEAGGELDRLKTQLDGWFNDTMDRISGVYKRQAQLVLLCLGLGLAVFLNVDTIRIVETLRDNTTLRNAVVEQAAKVAADKSLLEEQSFQKLQTGLAGAGFPIGWEGDNTVAWPLRSFAAAERDAMKALGLALTAVAISLGAPFCFDLLNQLVSLRSTGPKPARQGTGTDQG